MRSRPTGSKRDGRPAGTGRAGHEAGAGRAGREGGAGRGGHKAGAGPKAAAPRTPRAGRKVAMPRAPRAGYSGRPLHDKLGVKPGATVAALGLDDERGFLAELSERAAAVHTARPPKDADMVVFRAEAEGDLARLATLERTIRRDGAIWVVWPKGRPALKEDHVRAAALKVGLVDVKVCAFSETLSALKLMVPVARR